MRCQRISGKVFGFGYTFLDAVLAEINQARGQDFAHGGGRPCLTHRYQRDHIRRAARTLGCARQALADGRYAGFR